MAEIKLTIKDIPGGQVQVVSDPTFESMCKMNESGETWTSAHGYALRAINAIRAASKDKEPKSSLIHIPKLGLR